MAKREILQLAHKVAADRMIDQSIRVIAQSAIKKRKTGDNAGASSDLNSMVKALKQQRYIST